MIFHTFGNKENSAVMLLHGVLCPWQIWNTAVDALKDSYYVVVPELDGHTEDEKTVFVSVDDEAQKITGYIKEELGGKVFLLAGLSMGGRIAATAANTGDIEIDNLVLDGAPLFKISGLLKSIFKKNYNTIISKSKARDPKVIESAKRDFLPEEMIEHYLKVADNMEPGSIVNMIDSVFTDFEFKKYPDGMKIMFMHGTKGNESVSRKGAVRMKQVNPQTEIRCFDGLAHGELASFRPDQWIREVEDFIS